MPGAKAVFAPLPAAPISAPGFEGPFEVLLRLLDEGKLEITAVALLAVTEQYLAVLRLLPGSLPPGLPGRVPGGRGPAAGAQVQGPAAPPGAAVAEEAPPDEESLEARLAEYRRYRDAAGGACGSARSGASGPSPARRRRPCPRRPPPRLERADPGHLAAALQRLLALRAPAPGAPRRRGSPWPSGSPRCGGGGGHGAVSFTWLAGGCGFRART